MKGVHGVCTIRQGVSSSDSEAVSSRFHLMAGDANLGLPASVERLLGGNVTFDSLQEITTAAGALQSVSRFSVFVVDKAGKEQSVMRWLSWEGAHS